MKATAIITASVLLVGVFSVPIVWSDDDEHGEWYEYSRYSTGVALVKNQEYVDECGSCHMAYPPGLLPAVSWYKVMTGLDNHFGDNAELEKQSNARISQFLYDNSADKSNYRRSRRFARIDDPANAQLRITDTGYFWHEHHEIPDYMVKDNKDVLSFSNCNACHRKAEQASFRERDIIIPGYGRWDD